jgi:hypothetical protein
MGQFKPMVKMFTTEPTVELKLKKGGSAHKKMKSDSSSGHKSMKKMMDGGVLGALSDASMGAPMGNPMLQAAPVVAPRRRISKPSMAARRAAMAALASKARPMMKKGGEVESEATHKSEMKKINKVESELKSHEGKKASVAHKGLNKGGACYANGGIIKSTSGKSTINTAEHTTKTSGKTGDVKKGNGGGYKTGGVVLGNGGGYATGGVALGNAGGYKKGGSSKKAYASGGSVNDEGKATSMPQGAKRPSSPVSINRLSGTFKKGGNVSSKKLQNVFKSENAPALKASKKDSNEVYSVYGGKKKVKHFVGGGYTGDMTVGDKIPLSAPEGNVSDLAYAAVKQAEKAGRKTMIDPRKGSVTVKEREVTRTPLKVYPSGLSDTDIDKIISRREMQEALGRNVDKKRGGKVRK